MDNVLWPLHPWLIRPVRSLPPQIPVFKSQRRFSYFQLSCENENFSKKAWLKKLRDPLSNNNNKISFVGNAVPPLSFHKGVNSRVNIYYNNNLHHFDNPTFHFGFELIWESILHPNRKQMLEIKMKTDLDKAIKLNKNIHQR